MSHHFRPKMAHSPCSFNKLALKYVPSGVCFTRSPKTGACNFHKFVSRRFHGLEFTFRTAVSARILNIFKFHKPVSKTNRPNYDIFCLLLTFLVFLFDILYFKCAHRHVEDSIFAGKRALKCV